MKQLLKDITTIKDGESFDIVRVAMTIIIGILPFILLWGVIMSTLAFFMQRAFDMQGAFQAVLAFCVAAGAFLMSGSASLYFKRSTEPDSPEEIAKTVKPNKPDIAL